MRAYSSPFLAQYVMYLLEKCIPQLCYELPFLKKYVDDIICAVPRDSTDHILNIFYNCNQHIRFTLEKENGNSVPFLETRLIRTEDNTIILDWYISLSANNL